MKQRRQKPDWMTCPGCGFTRWVQRRGKRACRGACRVAALRRRQEGLGPPKAWTEAEYPERVPLARAALTPPVKV